MFNFKISRELFIVIVALFLSTNLHAATTPIGLGDFSGSETVIDFNSIANQELITTQYSGSGVTFSGAIYGLTNVGDTGNFPGGGGGVIASNWIYGGSGLQGLSFTANFSSTQSKVGFYVSTNDPDDTTIEVRLGAGLQGSASFDTGPGGSQNVIFIGVEEPNGFDSMTVIVQNNVNGFISLDDLRFENDQSSSAAIPTLSEWGIIIMSLILSGSALWMIRKRQISS